VRAVGRGITSARLFDGVEADHPPPPDVEETAMTSPLHRLGSASARHPWRVAAAWLVAIGVLTMLSMVIGGGYHDEMTVPGTSSDRALARLRTDLPADAGAEAHVVAKAHGARVDQADVRTVATALRALPHVRTVTSRFSDGDRIALLETHFDVELPALDAATVVTRMTAAARPLAAGGAQVAVGGQVPESIQGPGGLAEATGVGVALVVLLVAFGSVLAAGLPLLIAGAGLGAGLGLIGLLAATTEVASVSPTLGSMLGLGVGIDYSLLVVARHRQGVAARLSPIDAAAQATATAGKSVVFAGLSVLIGITGLAFSGVTGFASMGFAAALVIGACVVAAITLLPALLAALGPRAFGRRARRRAAESGALPADSFHSTWARRWGARITRRPVLFLVIGVLALLALAVPALHMRLGQNDAGSESTANPTRQAYDLVAEGFGPGANGPLLAVVDRARITGPALDALHAEVAHTPGVSAVSPVTTSGDGHTAVFQIIPATGPASAVTADLATRLHATFPAGADLTGQTAAMLDLTAALAAHLRIVILAVLAATFVLLTLVFRSLLLPAKAVLSNLLSVTACYGVMTLAFQTRIGASLIGLDKTVPIAGWAPMVLFAILFGLSMDYEVFMLSSVRDHHESGLSNRDSVVHGLASSSKIICYAAAIMVAVALGFALDSSVLVKIIGVGMATAILIDVTLVRLLIVPAAMAAFGKANWYLPRALDRILSRTAGHPARSERTTVADHIPADIH
jgi:RND superfamily putative drug exporter